MEWSAPKTKLSQQIGREMNRVARGDEHPAVVDAPEVVGVAAVVVQPPLVVAVNDFEHLQVAVRIGAV